MANSMKHILLALTFLSLAFNSQVWAQGYTAERTRKLAPGVVTVIRDANIDDAAIDETREFSELLSVLSPPDWTPNFDATTETLAEKAKKVGFQRKVWALEFGFKPLRSISVGGQNIYYLIYFVRNSGEARTPDKSGAIDQISGKAEPIRFIPSFAIQAHDRKRAYRESVRPDVVSMIASKERASRILHDSFSISRMDVPVSTSTKDRKVWGVAVWDNVDPKADFLSVFVGGLTNAYQWEPPKDGYDKTKTWAEQDTVKSKTLQLNFWRAGDDVAIKDEEIRYGLPIYPNDPERQQKIFEMYKVDQPIRHRWIYR